MTVLAVDRGLTRSGPVRDNPIFGQMKTLRFSLLVFLALSAVYLYAWPTPTLVYASVDLLHVATGLVLLIALVLTLSKLFRGTSRPARIGWALLLLGAMLGVALLFTGGRRPQLPWVYAHITACVAGVVVLMAEWFIARQRISSRADVEAPAPSQGVSQGRVAIAPALICGMLALAVAAVAAGAWRVRTASWQKVYRIENPAMAPSSMDLEGDGARGPFFPSSAQTVDGQKIEAKFFMESEGCKRCHADIYQQWFSSAHHFSSFNNQWYRKSVEYMQDVAGVRASKWCGGCHDPALIFSGMMDTPIRQIVNTPAAQAGLACVMCHSFARVKSTMGQGDYVLEYPVLDKMANTNNPLLRRLHDFVVELNPEPHRRVFLKPFMRNQTPQFCSTCHKVHLDIPVNRYRWFRGFNDYDNWQASGVSGEGARSFYYPAKPQTCAECHMPLVPSRDAGNVNGFIHSHRFPAANTALPYENEDATQLAEVEKFLKDSALSVDIFAVAPEPHPTEETQATEGPRSRLSTTFAVGEEAEMAAPQGVTPPKAVPVTAPLNRVDAVVRRGDTVRVDAVVRTRKVGHFFPGGTVDAFDVWLELKATDDKGQVLFWSGMVEDDGKGPVEPGAHFYRSLQIDAHGNPILKRNAWATRAVVYVRLIPPGAADTVRYRLHVPQNAGDQIRLEARLNYRKFSWWNTHFSFAGEPDPQQKDARVEPDYDDRHFAFTGDTSSVSGKRKEIPNLPIVTIAENSAALRVAPSSARSREPAILLRPEDWTRWNDYGIGLFLQGDLKAAEAAFEKITQIDPKNPDGWVNIGRVRVQEGNLDGAREVLDRALALSPQLARANFFYAKVLRDQGHYDEAIPHLQTVLAQYPRDRVARNELGRIFFLERRYAGAIKQFEATLAIDPEDLEANYNLMLCYTGLGQAERAADFQTRYLRFKANEASQALTGPYRQLHPDDNRERQAIHEHVSVPLGKVPAQHAQNAIAGKGKASD